jgi:hypothetical protein
MEGTSNLFMRWISAGLVIALIAPTARAQNTNQDSVPALQSQAPQISPPPLAGVDAPASGSQTDQSSSQLPDNPTPARSESPVRSESKDQSQPSPTSQSNPQSPSQGKTREPVGTAAAEQERTTGIAASKPAGTAIAPAKQKRVRMILIKVGALVGAGVAVGTVAALSSGSPSRPPGSH